MRKYGFVISGVLLAVLATGCASNTPREAEVNRLTPEEVAKLTPLATPTLSLEEIVTLSKQKMAADEVIEKIKASNSQYDFCLLYTSRCV